MTRRQMLLGGLAALGFAASCARQEGEPAIYTGKILTQADIRVTLGGWAFLGKLSYAEVNRDWLTWCYRDFRSWLGEGAFGVAKWDDRSQCTLFATAFEVYAQRRYFAHAFQGRPACARDSGGDDVVS